MIQDHPASSLFTTQHYVRTPGVEPVHLDNAVGRKLDELGNPYVSAVVHRFVRLCRPARVTVITDDPVDVAYVRGRALASGEEKPLATPGHTIHFDGPGDQARDKANTRVLLPPGARLSPCIATRDRTEGLDEVLSLMDGIMEGKELFVRFFALGPVGGRFTRHALQLTDSAYVAHSEDLLYRPGFEAFKALGCSDAFYTFVHSAGRTDERGCSVDLDQRRVYVDLTDSKVYSINNQYAGNSLGLKKLALRLAIHESNHADWLTEHMLIMGVHPTGKDRVTYFTGAYPSGCGKTSTAMVPGQSIVGDDIAYLRVDDQGACRAVNIESGVFGIIKDVNPEDDPLIHKVLTSQREMIFSNVLIEEGRAWWTGMGQDLPHQGQNHLGAWTSADGTPASHPNARYTIRLTELDNVDPRADDPAGVVIDGVLYGGRDSDTSVPVLEALSWEHGVFMGATIESETTATTLDAVGQRKHSPMAILDFMVVPLGRYLSNHLAFGQRLERMPRVFHTNYFLKHEGRYLNHKLDKRVWLLWAEGRVHGEYEALDTPVGRLPRYEDLRTLFSAELGRDYTRADYELQFSLRTGRLLAKLDRMEAIYRAEEQMPVAFWEVLEGQRRALEQLQATWGDTISPVCFEG